MIWCDRALIVGPHYCLCLSEYQFRKALKHIGVSDYNTPWIGSKRANATTHVLEVKGKSCCIVCLQLKEGVDYQQLCSLLVHEAVHIWQHFCESIGEDKPSTEFEAYGIQWLSQQLFYALEDLRGKP